MGAPLRERLHWHDGAVHDGPRRYLMMRPDVLMGAVAALDGAARAALLAAWAESTRTHGGQSLQAYAQQLGGDAQALMAATVAAAADLGWGAWALQPQADGLALQVASSPFVDGWRAAAGAAAPVPVCAPIRGLFTALATQVLGRPVTVTETRCAALHPEGGDATCHFDARAAA